MFRNTLTANDNYPVQDFGNFVVSDSNVIRFKTNNFFPLFFSFLESTSSVKHFEKKDDRHTEFLSEITQCQKGGYTSL